MVQFSGRWSSSSSAPTPSTANAGTTNYYVSQTLNGCESLRADIIVNVNALPYVNVPDISIYTDSTGILTANASGVTYLWQDGDTTAAVAVTVAGTYCVTVSDNQTNCKASACGIVSNAYNISGTLTYDNLENTPINNTSVTLLSTDDFILSYNTTNDSGKFLFNNVIQGTYYILPDITKAWGGGNPVDALMVNRYYIKAYNFQDDLLKQAADVNADGKINPVDALLINRRYIKAINSFVAGNWIYGIDSINVVDSNRVYNFKAVCVGDVNGSYSPN